MAERRGRELPKRFDPFRPAGWRCHEVAKMTHNKVAEEAEKVECPKSGPDFTVIHMFFLLCDYLV
jgi:hypothetical protein